MLDDRLNALERCITIHLFTGKEDIFYTLLSQRAQINGGDHLAVARQYTHNGSSLGHKI